MQITRRTALAGGAAAIVTGATVAPLALKATATKAALGGEEEAKAKKRAVLIKELRELALSMESKLDALQDKLDALQERLAGGVPS